MSDLNLPPARANAASTPDATESRYSRQVRLPEVGHKGQRRLAESRVAVVGVGALGSQAAGLLARAGVGMLRLIDRDIVELHNLQRQTLFDEDDATSATPKAIAAANHLRRINSQIQLEPVVCDVQSGNITQLLENIDLVLDGSDNFELRYLINDWSVANVVPWVYAGCIGWTGGVMLLDPGPKNTQAEAHAQPCCLRCVFDEPPPPGSVPTCDTAGVLGPAAAVVASWQAALALRWLATGTGPVGRLMSVDLWSGRSSWLDVPRRADCPCCGLGERRWLGQAHIDDTVSLCGRDAVQISPRPLPGNAHRPRLDLVLLSTALSGNPDVTVESVRPFMLRAAVAVRHTATSPDEPTPTCVRLSIFPDARAIIHGTSDISLARRLYARLVGH